MNEAQKTGDGEPEKTGDGEPDFQAHKLGDG